MLEWYISLATQLRAVPFYQPGMHSAPGWSYSCFAFVCLFVWLSVHPCKVWEAWKQVNGGSCHVWLFQVTWFFRLPAAKWSKMRAVLSTVEAQLSVQKRNITKATPEAREWQKLVASNEPASQAQKLRWCYGTLCPTYKRAPWCSRLASQLEFIVPLVGRPITCMVTP